MISLLSFSLILLGNKEEDIFGKGANSPCQQNLTGRLEQVAGEDVNFLSMRNAIRMLNVSSEFKMLLVQDENLSKSYLDLS